MLRGLDKRFQEKQNYVYVARFARAVARGTGIALKILKIILS